MTTIPLGFELGTGKPVNIPLRHTAVTGQTQESGKTTTLEAMITRSGLRAVCFITKKGEGSFSQGRVIQPYFRESADWEFVVSILGATMRESMKFQRSWIMKLCEAYHGKNGLCPAELVSLLVDLADGADALKSQLRDIEKARKLDYGWPTPKSLEDVARNVEVALLRARGLNESVYRELREFLRIVIPQIKRLPKADSVDLKKGVNVMWLDEYTPEMQGLIIRSVLEWITERETHTVTVIPEAWDMLPQNRSTPVLLACERLIRQGAANKNFIWLDSQDIAGVHKSILRQVGVWILGVQREIHETERALDHLPGGLSKPLLQEIQRLCKGQFFVAYGDEIKKTYIWPTWLTADEACAVAYTKSAPPPRPATTKTAEDEMWRERAEKAERRADELDKTVIQLQATIKNLQDGLERAQRPFPHTPESGLLPDIGKPGQPLKVEYTAAPPGSPQEEVNFIWEELRARLLADPVLVTVRAEQPEIQISVTRKIIALDGDTLRGKLAILLSEGFFDQGQAGYTAFVELKRRGAAIARPSVFNELNALAKLGIVTIEKNGSGQTYKRVPNLKITKNDISTV